jgi:hypothetical protein
MALIPHTRTVAYYTPDTLAELQTVDNVSVLRDISVPPGKYRSARSAKGRPREEASLPHGVYLSPVCTRKAVLIMSCTAPMYVEERQPMNQYIRPPSSNHAPDLAPLAYLQTIAPPRRHPLDEKALMALVPQLD